MFIAGGALLGVCSSASRWPGARLSASPPPYSAWCW